MLSRLVAPLGFIIALAALAFVMQTLGNSAPTKKSLTGPELLKQFEVVSIAPPATTLTDKERKKIDLPKLLIKPTLLTFWSVNCGECETGLPVLDSFAKSQSQVALILVNVKDEPKDAEEKLKSLKVTLASYYDLDGATFQSWEATMPASYFISNSSEKMSGGNTVNGKLKYFFPGRVSQEHLQALLTVR